MKGLFCFLCPICFSSCCARMVPVWRTTIQISPNFAEILERDIQLLLPSWVERLCTNLFQSLLHSFRSYTDRMFFLTATLLQLTIDTFLYAPNPMSLCNLIRGFSVDILGEMCLTVILATTAILSSSCKIHLSTDHFSFYVVAIVRCYERTRTKEHFPYNCLQIRHQHCFICNYLVWLFVLRAYKKTIFHALYTCIKHRLVINLGED